MPPWVLTVVYIAQHASLGGYTLVYIAQHASPGGCIPWCICQHASLGGCIPWCICLPMYPTYPPWYMYTLLHPGYTLYPPWCAALLLRYPSEQPYRAKPSCCRTDIPCRGSYRHPFHCWACLSGPPLHPFHCWARKAIPGPRGGRVLISVVHDAQSGALPPTTRFTVGRCGFPHVLVPP